MVYGEKFTVCCAQCSVWCVKCREQGEGVEEGSNVNCIFKSKCYETGSNVPLDGRVLVTR